MSANLPTTYPGPLGPEPRTGLSSELEQVGTDYPTSIQLCRISFQPVSGSVQTHSGEVENFDLQDKDPYDPIYLLSQVVHVINRPVDSHREAGHIRPSSHEGHSLAPKESLECSRVFGEDHSSSQISPSSSGVVARQRKSTL